MDKITIPDLNGTNYFISELKMKAVLRLKRLDSLILNEKPEDLTRKDEMDWITKNSDAIAYIKLSLADEQALQFATEDNAKVLWDKIRATYIGEGEDRKIDAGNELKNIRMKNGETVADYIARARGISTKCHSLGLDVSPRELVYHTVRGLNGKFSKVHDILKTQRGKSMDEILQILMEKEATLNLPLNFKLATFKKQLKTRMNEINFEAFYCKRERKNEKQTRLCYICRKSNHLAKDCYYRNKNSPSTSQRNNSSRNGHVFTASHREEKLCDNIWILDSGASCHMAKESVWFKNISPEVMDIYLADKNSKMMSQGTGNVSAKTVSTKHCNSINRTNTDVSYVPQLRCNLLSVTCLMDKGFSPERNEINQNTENGVLYNFDINNGPGAIENGTQFPSDHVITSDRQNPNAVNNVPNSYFEAENSANWKNWKLAMENELDSLENIKGDGVCVLPPPGYEKLIGDDKVCKLKKSIYGLSQSGRNWYMKIKGELENFGLKQLASDNCVFIKSVNQSVLIQCMYVDDLAIFCNNDKMYEDIVNNAVTLNSDSQAAIQWIKGTRSSNKSRHMNLRFHFIKDLIVIKLEYVQTEFLIADFLTKAMNVEKLEYSMQKIALLS
ncbi:retrovirus-related Pol polyprotein from transposon TNT 1-94 [Trichonephila clavipes]|nr:retrovirus-related Pol polyprotein from transposon TNT 1-94 [Trichonephila clavipes]